MGMMNFMQPMMYQPPQLSQQYMPNRGLMSGYSTGFGPYGGYRRPRFGGGKGGRMRQPMPYGMGGGKQGAVSATKMRRNYRKEYDNYHSKPKQKKNRAKRKRLGTSWRRQVRSPKGDGKDVGHKKPLAKGGSNKKGNLKVASKSKNRSFKRTKTARMA